MSRFLTVDDLATEMHRSKRTIQRWARERRIPHIRIGRAILFTQDQVDEIATAYTRQPAFVAIEHELPNPGYSPSTAVVVPMMRPGDAA